MQAIEIAKNIYWVGAIDWNVRNFHGYLTPNGTTYNAFLIIDEKITLIDTVKANFKSEMIHRISNIIDPKKIDVIICNHVEKDHSGSMPELFSLCPGAKVLASPKGIDGLKEHYVEGWQYEEVSNGLSYNIGSRDLVFHFTPMVHWPDNMVAYCPQDKLLFSNDAFGQHHASWERSDSEFELDTIIREAKKYYANIVMPYGGQIKKTLNSLKSLDIDMIACSHGLIWKQHTEKIINAYQYWVSNPTPKKAVIVYDTMWEATEKMARAIYSAFEDAGYHCRLACLQATHISDIIPECLDSEYICVGSPTLNRNMMPSIAGFLTYWRGLSPGGKKGVAFGSYGWGGTAVKQIETLLQEAKCEVTQSIKIKYTPTHQDLVMLKQKLKLQLSAV